MNLIICEAAPTDPARFVEFWGSLYSYKLEPLYDRNIGLELTVGRLKRLFRWKNGLDLSGRKGESVRRNCLARLGELRQLRPDESPESFLKKFAHGGAIWRIFFLHCWSPNRFPIFDQHVYRAMRFIRVPRIPIEHDLPEEQKMCRECPTPHPLERIGHELRECYRYEAPKISVEEHIRWTYACTQTHEHV